MADLRTLAIDIGGTGLKASVLDPDGKMMHDKAWRPTPDDLSPHPMVEELKALAAPCRISTGSRSAFPARSVAAVCSRRRISPVPTGTASPSADAVAARPSASRTRLGNDADIQGMGVVVGPGHRMRADTRHGRRHGVVPGRRHGARTWNSRTIRCTASTTYNDYVGRDALHKVGHKRWNKRVHKVIGILVRAGPLRHAVYRRRQRQQGHGQARRQRQDRAERGRHHRGRRAVAGSDANATQWSGRAPPIASDGRASV